MPPQKLTQGDFMVFEEALVSQAIALDGLHGSSAYLRSSRPAAAAAAIDAAAVAAEDALVCRGGTQWTNAASLDLNQPASSLDEHREGHGPTTAGAPQKLHMQHMSTRPQHLSHLQHVSHMQHVSTHPQPKSHEDMALRALLRRLLTDGSIPGRASDSPMGQQQQQQHLAEKEAALMVHQLRAEEVSAVSLQEHSALGTDHTGDASKEEELAQGAGEGRGIGKREDGGMTKGESGARGRNGGYGGAGKGEGARKEAETRREEGARKEAEGRQHAAVQAELHNMEASRKFYCVDLEEAGSNVVEQIDDERYRGEWEQEETSSSLRLYHDKHLTHRIMQPSHRIKMPSQGIFQPSQSILQPSQGILLTSQGFPQHSKKRRLVLDPCLLPRGGLAQGISELIPEYPEGQYIQPIGTPVVWKGDQGEGTWELCRRGVVPAFEGALFAQLMEAATALDNSNLPLFQTRFKALSQYSNPEGPVTARLVHYMLQGLLLRCSGMGFQAFNTPCSLPSQDIDSAWMTISKVLPCVHNSQIAAFNGVCSLLSGEHDIHVIEFGGLMMTQWPAVFRTLAREQRQSQSLLPNHASHLGPLSPPPIRFRLTLVNLTSVISPQPSDKMAPPPQADPSPWLKRAAAAVGIKLDVEQVALDRESLPCLISAVERRPKEALVVVSFLDFDFLVDNSVINCGIRETILEWICHLEPKGLFLVSQEVEATTQPFPERFQNLLEYLYTSLAGHDTVSQHHQCWATMLTFEQAFVVRSVFNQIACEGAERVVRTCCQNSWRHCMESAGLIPGPVFGVDKLYGVIESLPDGFGFQLAQGNATMTYQGLPTLAFSSWIPRC